MARPPATPEQRAEIRERLRRAANEIRRDEGIEAVTVRSVTRLAGVSSGALYNSFTSIGELLRSLWLEPVLATGEALERMVERTPDPVERIRALLEGFVDFASQRPELHRSAMLFVRPLHSPEPETRDASVLPFYTHLRQAICDAQALGDVRAGDPDHLTQLAWSAVHGAMALPINAQLFELRPGPDVAADMIDVVISGLRPSR